MERAAVPPRTIKKVSDLFWAATFILDFLGEIFSRKKHHPQRQICHWNPLRSLMAHHRVQSDCENEPTRSLRKAPPTAFPALHRKIGRKGSNSKNLLPVHCYDFAGA